jgi:hypothetical protein
VTTSTKILLSLVLLVGACSAAPCCQPEPSPAPEPEIVAPASTSTSAPAETAPVPAPAPQEPVLVSEDSVTTG